MEDSEEVIKEGEMVEGVDSEEEEEDEDEEKDGEAGPEEGAM